MLTRLLSGQVEHAYGLLRIVAGFMFSVHGMQKIFGILAASTPPVGSQIWFGGLIELATGLLMMVGFFTREAAFLASGTMAVAYIQFHWKLAVDSQILPIVNKGELAALYSFLFLYVACRGPGVWSLDRRRS